MPQQSSVTIPRQFRLTQVDLGIIDWLAAKLSPLVGTPLKRTEVVRRAIHNLYVLENGPGTVPPPQKKSRKKSPK